MEEPEDAVNEDFKELFITWLDEWYKELAEKNSHAHHAYGRARSSLQQCPVPVKHPKELLQLQGFGKTICTKIEKKLDKHCKKLKIPLPVLDEPEQEAQSKTAKEKTNTNRKRRPFIPKVRSGAYAVLRTLFEHHSGRESKADESGLSKIELSGRAQQYSDEPLGDSQSLGERHGSSRRTSSGWAGVTKLVSNNLVYTSSKPARYYITDYGKEVITNILRAEGTKFSSPLKKKRSLLEMTDTESDAEVSASPKRHNSIQEDDEMMESMQVETTKWSAGTYGIRLLIDNREIGSQADRMFFKTQLTNKNVECEIRVLGVGDFMWVAYHHDSGEYAVLDYIVERKRFDDLCSSIIDGRFHEQKHRLHRCGLTHVVYVIEDIGGNLSSFHNKMLPAITTAISSTQMVDRFFVKRTENPMDTAQYLAQMTRVLNKYYESRDLHVVDGQTVMINSNASLRKFVGIEKTKLVEQLVDLGIPLDTFNLIASKSSMTTVGDIFLKMLMSIKGISWDKARQIQREFPTPRCLFEAYENIGQENDDDGGNDKGTKITNMVADKCDGPQLINRKKIGNVLSARIAQSFCPPHLL